MGGLALKRTGQSSVTNLVPTLTDNNKPALTPAGPHFGRVGPPRTRPRRFIAYSAEHPGSSGVSVSVSRQCSSQALVVHMRLTSTSWEHVGPPQGLSGGRAEVLKHVAACQTARIEHTHVFSNRQCKSKPDNVWCRVRGPSSSQPCMHCSPIPAQARTKGVESSSRVEIQL